MTFRGSCHCGKIAYSVDEEPPRQGIECNCSICRRKGYVHHFTTPDKLTLEASRDDIQVYEFNKHAIRHQFCKTCGCAAFAEGTGPNGQPMVEINLRCADELDVSKLKLVPFDGASL